MIPKIIHYCWLSGDPFPPEIKVCIDSWKKVLPEYEFVCWDTNRFDLDSCPWVKQAFESKKYAFAADYIRLYAVYNYGGIYLDSDVMMYKPFDDLLNLPYFWGEDTVHCFEPAIFGAEKGTQWIKDILERYEGRFFLKEDGSYDMKGLPVVVHERLCNKYKFELTELTEDYIYRNDVIRIFPKEYFNSRNFIKPIQTKDSYCSHHFVGSWLPKSKKRGLMRIKNWVPDFILNKIYAVAYHLLYKKNMSDILIPYSD